MSRAGKQRGAIVNSKKYIGRFVAMASFNKRSVVASGKDPVDVMNRAEKKGYQDPLVIFVPPKGVVSIY